MCAVCLPPSPEWRHAFGPAAVPLASSGVASRSRAPQKPRVRNARGSPYRTRCRPRTRSMSVIPSRIPAAGGWSSDPHRYRARGTCRSRGGRRKQRSTMELRCDSDRQHWIGDSPGGPLSRTADDRSDWPQRVRCECRTLAVGVKLRAPCDRRRLPRRPLRDQPETEAAVRGLLRLEASGPVPPVRFTSNSARHRWHWGSGCPTLQSVSWVVSPYGRPKLNIRSHQSG